MKALLPLILMIAAVGCGRSPDVTANGGSGKADVPDVKPIPGLDRYGLGAPVSYGNVTIVPVTLSSKMQAQRDDYMSLAEAKKEGLVEISEMPQGQEVNRLFVKNLGKKPLLLLSGELLLGGKQDRVVAKDTVVPGGEEMAVPCFCVEHGRWTGASDKFEFSDSMAPQSVRAKATFGTQEQVWDEVKDYNQSAGVAAPTGTVRGGLGDKTVVTRIDSDLRRFQSALDNQKNVVGLVYIVNGQVGSLELFGNEELLNSSREALLRGFLADAAVRPSDRSKELDLDGVAKFVKESLLGVRRQTELGRGQANWSVMSGDMRGAESTLPQTATPAAKAGPDTSSLLHGSYTLGEGSGR